MSGRARSEQGEALFAKALEHHRARRLDEAEALYRQVLAIEPDLDQALENLGVLLQQRGDFATAAARHAQALALRPGHSTSRLNLGAALQRLGRLDEAAEQYRAVLAAAPNHAAAHANLGLTLRGLDRPDEALSHLEAAVAAQPDSAAFHNNLGLALQDLGRLDAAIAAFARASELAPDFAEARMSLGAARLLAGDFVGGWGEYEHRLARPDVAQPSRPGPRWRGEPLDHVEFGLNQSESKNVIDSKKLERVAGGKPLRAFPQPALAGKTLLLQGEQGLGDAIQFSRYAALAAGAGAEVVLSCKPPLRRLFGTLKGPVRVIDDRETPPPYDLWAPLMSLPGLFGTTLETIPGREAYLAADPAAVARWRTRLSALPGLKLGVAWRGGGEHQNDRNRSIGAAPFAPLLATPGVSAVSLHPDARRDELEALGASVLDAGAALTDMAETAALVAALDLVICVDTSVAHLAGALGAPAWVTIPFAPDWRWLIGRADSPWYGSLRLFRQSARGDWPGVIADVRVALQRRIDGAP